MKTIVNIILISIIIVAIIGYAENRTTQNIVPNTSDKDNYSFLALNQSLIQKPSYIFYSPELKEKFSIQSNNWNFINTTIIINISYIKNISFDNDKMVIQTLD